MHMRLQLGMLHRQSKAAGPSDLAFLLGDCGSWKADVAGAMAQGSLLMAYRGLRTTPEDECQPLARNPYILTWDGRLDNRKEMADRAGLAHSDAVSDPFIVLNLYARLGDAALSDIIGEFALCLWSEKTRVMCFARSICGTRPLYYVLQKDKLIWSTDFEHLVRISQVDLDVNESYLIEYLITQPSPRHTALNQIATVAPGSVLKFRENTFLPERALWNPQNIATLHYGTDAEYEEHCRYAISEAVRVRLRARRPLFAELSGGLDSSAVVVLADAHLRTTDHSTADLKTVSCVYEKSSTGDEHTFIRAVEEKRGNAGFHVRENEQQITIGLGDVIFAGVPNPLHCFPGRYREFSKFMREHDARVLLTGLGGDHLFWSEPDGALLVADELQHAHFLRMHRECRTWSRLLGTPYLTLLLQVALPLALGRIFSNEVWFGSPEIPSWLSEAQRAEVRSRVWEFNTPRESLDTVSRSAQLHMVKSLFALISAGFFNEYRDLCLSHPYSHRPLIEFCLAVPISQFLRQGQTRSLMRRALRDVLPPKVLNRKSKGMLDEAFARAVRQEWSTIGNLRRWHLCERGFAEANALGAYLNRLRLGLPARGVSAIRLFSLERWLRSLDNVRRETRRECPPHNELILSPLGSSMGPGHFIGGATCL